MRALTTGSEEWNIPLACPPWRLIDAQTGRGVVESLELADGYWSRLIGWQFRRRPEIGRGLLLVPCSSVHTCLLRFPLDLAMLDRSGRVLAVRHAVRPWRVVLPIRHTHAILELPSGGAEIRPDQTLRARARDGRRLAKSLRFLSD
jgi:uncharacterized membrane protein (UPF0127 family)